MEPGYSSDRAMKEFCFGFLVELEKLQGPHWGSERFPRTASRGQHPTPKR